MTALITIALIVALGCLQTSPSESSHTVLFVDPGAIESAIAYEAPEGIFNVAIQLNETCSVALAEITRTRIGEMLELYVTDGMSVRVRVMATIDSGNILLRTSGQVEAERMANRFPSDAYPPPQAMTPGRCFDSVD